MNLRPPPGDHAQARTDRSFLKNGECSIHLDLGGDGKFALQAVGVKTEFPRGRQARGRSQERALGAHVPARGPANRRPNCCDAIFQTTETALQLAFSPQAWPRVHRPRHRALAARVGRSPLVRPHQTGHDVYRQREHCRIEKERDCTAQPRQIASQEMRLLRVSHQRLGVPNRCIPIGAALTNLALG